MFKTDAGVVAHLIEPFQQVAARLFGLILVGDETVKAISC
jgi:hypothetical protein